MQRCSIRSTATQKLGALSVPDLLAQLVVAIDDVTPIMLTRVLHQHQHLAKLTQFCEGFHGLHGQGRNTEHHDAGWQARGSPARGLAFCDHYFESRHEFGVNACTREIRQRRSHIGPDVPPQLGLPGVRRIERGRLPIVRAQDVGSFFTCGPITEPVSPVTLVAVQHIRHLQGQLIKLAAIGVAAQIPL